MFSNVDLAKTDYSDTLLAHRLLRRVGADVSGARAFRRWLFIKADPLTFVQFIKTAGGDRAPMKEPLLAALIPDKPETTIAHQSFNRPVRHVD